jgi:predicted dehydrogenase
MLKYGLFGVGHLGKIHLKCAIATGKYEIIGFYDPNDDNAEKIIQQFGIQRFTEVKKLLSLIDVADIVTPTITHFDLAAQAIRASCHVFIEKPVTETLAEAKKLLRLQEKYAVQVQVGHVERFNPAMLVMNGLVVKPMFIEAHRLANFNARGTDVSVVLDLMIHDIDIVLALVGNTKVKSVHAGGVSVVSRTPDIANARIEFENGCIANLTASRISMKQMRKLRLFQQDAYISLDFLDKKAQIVRLFDEKPEFGDTFELPVPDIGTKYIHIDMPETKPVNAIELELSSFADAILGATTPIVTLQQGVAALALAHRVLKEIEKRTK